MSSPTHAASRPRLLLVGLIVAVSMTTIDQTIVSLAAPTIQDSLGVDADALTWMVNAYLLATAAAFPAAGRLADLRGYRPTMLVGVAVFGGASIACALTPSGASAAAFMIAARAVQGIGAAVMFAAAVGLVVATSSTERRASSMALFFGFTGAMTALGPVLGSFLIEWSWRAIFLINVPLAVASAVIVATLAPRGRTRREPFDAAGAVLAALAMGCVVLALQRGGDWGWTSTRILVCVGVGVAAAAGFVAVERVVARPLVSLALFRSRAFSLAAVASLLGAAVFIPLMLFLSVYGQLALGRDLLSTSELLGEFFLGFLLAAQLGARLFERRGLRPVLAISGALGSAGFVWSAHGAGVQGGISPMMLLLSGAAVGFMFSPSATAMVNHARGATYGEVTALSQTMKNLGGAIGMAALTSLSTRILTSELTTALTPLGAGDDQIDSIASAVTGMTADVEGLAPGVPPEVRLQILETVRDSYATATAGVLLAMAATMSVLLLLAFAYPRRQPGRLHAPVDGDPLESPRSVRSSS